MKRPRPKPPLRIGTAPPRAYEVELRRAVWPMVRQVQAAAAKAETLGDVRDLGVELRKRWSDKRIEELVRRVVAKAELAASRPWSRVVRGDARRKKTPREYDGPALVERWTKAAAKHITSVRDEAVDGIRADVAAAIKNGTPPAELAARWKAQGIPLKWGTLEGRVRVIAQHQMSMLHAEVQRERAKAVGVTEFVWRSQGDDRVRDEHAQLDGNTFSYREPPSEGLPGTPVNCRCWAESVVPDELLGGFGVAGVIDN